MAKSHLATLSPFSEILQSFSIHVCVSHHPSKRTCLHKHHPQTLGFLAFDIHRRFHTRTSENPRIFSASTSSSCRHDSTHTSKTERTSCSSWNVTARPSSNVRYAHRCSFFTFHNISFDSEPIGYSRRECSVYKYARSIC